MSIISQEFITFLQSLVSNPFDIVVHIIDIALVAFLFYSTLTYIRGTKLMSLIQGVFYFVVFKYLADVIGLDTISWLMSQFINYGVIAAVVIFAPEIRTILERFGRTTQLFQKGAHSTSDEEQLIQALTKSVAYMSPRKIGALICIQGGQTLQEYISTGIALDANVSSELLINIFIPNTPLHDGAVIIQGNKIAATCAYLPLSESTRISKEYGTRHRAAIGMSEVTDALTIVVSEETGKVSVTHKGRFLNDISKEDFEKVLKDYFLPKETKAKKSFFAKMK